MPRDESIVAVLERLGSTLLTHEAGPAGHSQRFEQVAMIDSTGDDPIPARALVLGVGIRGAGPILDQLRRVSDAGSCVLIVRGPADIDEAVRERAATAEITVLSLAASASWLQLASLLQPHTGLADDSWTAVGTAEAEVDLFKVANSLSMALDAPVSIEDLRLRVLAFSADQARADDARKVSVLGQQVPNTYQTPLTAQGHFRRLYASPRPIFIEPFVPGVRPRVAYRVAAGEELLGAIWAIVDQPLSAAQEEAMIEAGNVAAIAMLRTRIGADAVHRMRFAAVATLLEGGQAAFQAATRLRTPGPIVGGYVLAAGLPDDGGPVSSARMSAGLDHVASSLMMLLRGELSNAICALLGDTIYAVVPVCADEVADLSVVRRLAERFVQRLGRDWERLQIGIGAPVSHVTDLNRSRDDADLVLRALRVTSYTDTAAVRVATRQDVQARLLLLRLSDLLAADPAAYLGPLDKLRSYDQEHEANLLLTLRCWLDNFGDVAATSAQLQVHKNTLRYRLKRISQITEADLNDTEKRFELMLQFRLLRYSGRSR